uniref:Guanylate cyclase domain-containing protein n=1 Tax=Percolomonas cosmopolitus TaxID=63605 RepID=A0A7S1KTY3_9EUKA|mmetsp:Transcript_8781/g.32488  ORF Transcript_8781/g.32488 Transcript_8781/m.32488 type:complete len:965 (+) Transcript_8781:465-3359(+)|eukprot:CAMPEP_0117443582 /NCGR_PEP_ID=MMETSP0759-20121206/4768_1 /TAXON_ID=63605 /ORGANISM="Percolomonas cosmopolitus, Strain WS" /LENGTH=964 /DNA_ID=CAMNT_0005235559 /DNA_START=467 /DNA_END=3361 /DNA_ORIENTATION=+
MDPLVVPDSPPNGSGLSPITPKSPIPSPDHHHHHHSNSKLPNHSPSRSNAHEQQDYLNKYLVSISKYSFPPKESGQQSSSSEANKIAVAQSNNSSNNPSKSKTNGFAVVSGSQRYSSPYISNSGLSLADKLKAIFHYHKQCFCSARFFLFNIHSLSKNRSSKHALSFFCFIVSFLFIILLGTALLCIIFWGEFSIQTISESVKERSQIYQYSVDQLQDLKAISITQSKSILSLSNISSTNTTNYNTEALIAEYPFESFRDEWRLYIVSRNLSQFISHIDTSFATLFVQTKYKSSLQLMQEIQILNQLYGVLSEMHWFVGGEILARGTFNATPSHTDAFKAQQRVYLLLQREEIILSALQVINGEGYQLDSDTMATIHRIRMYGNSLIDVDRSQSPETHALSSSPSPVSQSDWNALVDSYKSFVRSKLGTVEHNFGSSESSFKRSSSTTFAVSLVVFVVVGLCCFSCTICCIACTKLVHHCFGKKKYENIVLALSAASDWDLTNPYIERLLSIPEHKASPLQSICQIIIHQLSDVKPYLPTHIFDHDPLASTKPRSFSIESSISSNTSHGAGGCGATLGDYESNTNTDKARANSFSDSFLSSPSPSSMSHRLSVFSNRLGSMSSRQLAFNLRRRRSTITSSRNNAGLVEKEATLMMIDVVDFHNWVNKHDLESFNDNYHRFVTTVCDLIRHERGMIHWISGDKIFCTFGCASKVFQCENRACQSALSIVRLTKTKLAELGIALRIGIASGKVLAGPIGNKTFKTFSCIGNVVNRLYSLCRLNKHYSSEILIDSYTFQASQTHFVARMVDCLTVRGENDNMEPLRIYELMENKQVSENEWMYQLSESEEKEKFRNYHTVWDQCMKQNYQDAEFLLDKLVSENPKEANAIPSEYLFRLKAIIQTGRKESKINHAPSSHDKWKYEACIPSFGIRTNVPTTTKTSILPGIPSQDQATQMQEKKDQEKAE